MKTKYIPINLSNDEYSLKQYVNAYYRPGKLTTDTSDPDFVYLPSDKPFQAKVTLTNRTTDKKTIVHVHDPSGFIIAIKVRPEDIAALVRNTTIDETCTTPLLNIKYVKHGAEIFVERID